MVVKGGNYGWNKKRGARTASMLISQMITPRSVPITLTATSSSIR